MTDRHHLCGRHTICKFADSGRRVLDAVVLANALKRLLFGARLVVCPLQGKKQKGISSPGALIEMPIVTLLAHGFRLKT